MSDLTDPQLREISQTIAHLGRAMRSMERAKLPKRIDYPAPDWLLDLDIGERLIRRASDSLIAGLEKTDWRKKR